MPNLATSVAWSEWKSIMHQLFKTFPLAHEKKQDKFNCYLIDTIYKITAFCIVNFYLFWLTRQHVPTYHVALHVPRPLLSTPFVRTPSFSQIWHMKANNCMAITIFYLQCTVLKLGLTCLFCFRPPVINNPTPYIIHASSASTTSSNGSTSRKKNNNEPPSEISV